MCQKALPLTDAVLKSKYTANGSCFFEQREREREERDCFKSVIM